ncbi:MAG: hypothetical protein WCC48_18515 [Anaeromyxobacteraceae bacterium]
MKWTGAAVVAMTLVTGCAGQLGGSRGRIRQIEADTASRCKYLGVVQSVDRSGWKMSDDQLGAMTEIRKRVAALGGNAYVMTHGKSYSTGSVVRADAYRCP